MPTNPHTMQATTQHKAHEHTAGRWGQLIKLFTHRQNTEFQTNILFSLLLMFRQWAMGRDDEVKTTACPDNIGIGVTGTKPPIDPPVRLGHPTLCM